MDRIQKLEEKLTHARNKVIEAEASACSNRLSNLTLRTEAYQHWVALEEEK